MLIFLFQMQPSRRSNAIGLGFLGIGLIFVTTTLYRWQIGPMMARKRMREAEEWADMVFEKEQGAKHLDDSSRMH